MKSSSYNIFIKTNKQDEYVVFNTLTCAAFIVDEEAKNAIENASNETQKSIDKNSLDELKKRGIIIDDEVNEKNIIEVWRQDGRFHPEYIKFVVLTTWSCNLKCTYCFEGGGEKISGNITEEKLDSIIKFIKNKSLETNRKVIDLILFGGEPLVNIKACNKLLKEIYTFCKERELGFIPGLVTNGTLITKEILQEFSKYNMDFIQVTLDGPKRIHDKRRIYKDGRGTYDEVINAIKLIRESDIDLIIAINIDKENQDSIEELLDELVSYGFQGAYLNFVDVYAMTEACSGYAPYCFVGKEWGKIFPHFLELAKKKGFTGPMNVPTPAPIFCGTEVKYSYIIDPDAKMYKCVNFLGDDRHCIGQIQKDGTEKKVLYPYYDLMSRNPLKIKRCQDCKLLPLCAGGCASFAYAEENTYHDGNCRRIKYGFEQSILLKLKNTYPDKFD